MLAGPAIPCSALLRVGFAKPPRSPGALVRSYRTVSPLPDPVGPGFPGDGRPSAVCFLWHFPAGRPDWPLASTLPCGAPTFLDTIAVVPRPPGRLTVAAILAHRRLVLMIRPRLERRRNLIRTGTRRNRGRPPSLGDVF